MKTKLILILLAVVQICSCQNNTMEKLTKTTEYNELSSLSLNKNNWLFYIKDNLRVSNNSRFIKEMNSQLVPQIESKLGFKVDWEKVWLFFEPISDQIIEEIIDGNSCMKMHSAQITVPKYYSVNCSIYWYSNNSNEYVNTSELMNNVQEIVFKLESIDLANSEMVPRAVDKKESFLYKYQNQTYFPIVTSSKSVLAENHMIIELSNESELEKIKKVMGETTLKWEEKYGETQNRLGVLYPIMKQISNYYILYYEPSLLGHEFIELLGNDLSNSTKTIKSILIESSSNQGLN